eukprot:scaffold71210_cov78-Phaeocystis_antarctica.AAC.4
MRECSTIREFSMTRACGMVRGMCGMVRGISGSSSLIRRCSTCSRSSAVWPRRIATACAAVARGSASRQSAAGEATAANGGGSRKACSPGGSGPSLASTCARYSPSCVVRLLPPPRAVCSVSDAEAATGKAVGSARHSVSSSCRVTKSVYRRSVNKIGPASSCTRTTNVQKRWPAPSRCLRPSETTGRGRSSGAVSCRAGSCRAGSCRASCRADSCRADSCRAVSTRMRAKNSSRSSPPGIADCSTR